MNQISVSQKIGIKEEMRAFFLNAPESALNAIDLPGLVVGSELKGEFDYLHFFTKTQAEMNDSFPKLKELASLLKTKHQLGHGNANAMWRTFWLKSENLLKDTS